MAETSITNIGADIVTEVTFEEVGFTFSAL